MTKDSIEVLREEMHYHYREYKNRRQYIRQAERNKAIKASEAPFAQGRIIDHAKRLLTELGPQDYDSLIERLLSGGAGLGNADRPKEVKKSVDRGLTLKSLIRTSSGIDIAKRPSKKRASK